MGPGTIVLSVHHDGHGVEVVLVVLVVEIRDHPFPRGQGRIDDPAGRLRLGPEDKLEIVGCVCIVRLQVMAVVGGDDEGLFRGDSPVVPEDVYRQQPAIFQGFQGQLASPGPPALPPNAMGAAAGTCLPIAKPVRGVHRTDLLLTRGAINQANGVGSLVSNCARH